MKHRWAARRHAVVAASLLSMSIFALQPAFAQPQHPTAATEERAETPPRSIAISMNGSTFAGSDAALLANRRLYVPLRALLSSLGLDFMSRGPQVTVALPSGAALQIHLNSSDIAVGSHWLKLDAPALMLNGRIYVPVQVIERAFGGIIRYDERSAHLALFVHVTDQAFDERVTPPITGTLTNVDHFSTPPVISLLLDDQVRTFRLSAAASIRNQDVVAGTRLRGSIDTLHVGDLVSASFASDGSAKEIVDSFRSRNGHIAAVAPDAIALRDGHIVMPTRSTTITLNSKPVGLNALRVGDAVTVRSNPESLEVREILASRPVPPRFGDAAAIRQVAFTPEHPLKANEELNVYLRGPQGGTAAFDLGMTADRIPMSEVEPGLYHGRYIVVPGASFLDTPVIGHIVIKGQELPAVSAAETFSAATLPPQVVEVAPREGQVVNDTRAAIYASFVTPTNLGVDPASIHLWVNEREVTGDAHRTSGYVSYQPADLPFGPVTVRMVLADRAGNQLSYHWVFVCGGQ